MKTIGIDCRFAGTHSGLGRYTQEITLHLLQRNDPLTYRLFVRSASEPWIQMVPQSTRWSLEEASYPHYSLGEQLGWRKKLRHSPVDLLFCPHFNAPLLAAIPKVITIHDLILHHYPNEASFLRKQAYRYVFDRALRDATKIITVSSFTATELAASYGESVRGKVTVIPEGVGGSFMPKSHEEVQRVREKHGIKEPYFLYVGNAKEHKNVQTLIDAFTKLETFPPHSLILVTAGKECERLSLRGHPRIKVVTHIPDTDLPSLYTGAACFVTASLYEGFCLPVLEALACQCPVIATHTGAIPEWTGSAARLIPPTLDALTDALKNPPARPQKLPLPHWEEAAEKTAHLLQEVVA